MSPADYALLADGVGAGVCAAAGYGMLTLSPSRIGAIRGCFWAAGIGFGSLGVVWAVWGADPAQSLTIRLVIAGATAAVAAMGLTWALWQITDHTRVDVRLAGKGGDAQVVGNRSGAVGGDAGESGIWSGGPGGDATVHGDYSYARGGAGSNAPQPDGRGGRAAKGPLEIENRETSLWKYGRGGIGASAPEYNRRLALLTKIRNEYIQEFPDETAFIEAGIDPVPINWVNKRLEELGEHWRVTMGNGGYVLPPLNSQ